MASAELAAPALSKDVPAPQAESAKRQALAPSVFPVDRLSRKNPWVAALFALLFGPLGILYVSPGGALVMCAVYVLLRVFFAGRLVGALVVWPISIFWAAMAARE
jgi:hypothetical protein